MKNDMRSEERDETETQGDLLLFATVTFFVKRHWRSLVAGIAVALVSFGVLACGVYCLLPVHTEAWTELRFIFKGINQDQYPNGLPFAAEELLAVPVLDEVYRRNGVEAYLTFDQFAKNLSVSQSNRQLDALERRYRGLLEDKKLSAAERSRLENDWYRQSQQLRSAQYTLYFSMQSRRLPPTAVVRKVLADIPMVWADLAIRQAGVLAYDVVGVSPLSEPALAAKPPLDAFQEVYVTAGALRGEIVALARLPGTEVLRPPAVHATLEDVRIGLDSFVRSQLPAAYRDVLTASLRRDPEGARRRFDALVNALSIRAEAANSQATNLINSYQYYMQKGVLGGDRSEAATPAGGTYGSGGGTNVVAQIDSGFLDRISGMATQSLDFAYRQKLIDNYTDARNRADAMREELTFAESNIKLALAEKPVLAPAAPEAAGQSLAALVKPLNALVEQADQLWRQVSRNNLENGTSLYQTVKPFQMQRCGVLSWRWWFAALVAWNGGICLLLVGVLWWRDNSASGVASRCISR